MFQLQNTISIGDLISFVLLIVTALTVFFAYLQIKASYTAQKTEFFKELYQIMFSDPDIRDAYLLIEYEHFSYGDHFHDSSPFEKSIDRLLSFFDLLCDLYSQKILTEHEMSFFKYKILRVYQNPSIQKYLNFLGIFYLTTGIQMPAHPAFLAYGEKELLRLQQANSPDSLYLTIDQAYVFYEEQKGKLDKILEAVEQKIPMKQATKLLAEHRLHALDALIRYFQIAFVEQQIPVRQNEAPDDRKLRILDMLKHYFSYVGNANEEIVMRQIIDESEVYDPSRLIIGLEALRAKFLLNEDQTLQAMYNIPDRISIRHLFRHASERKSSVPHRGTKSFSRRAI